MKKQMNKFSFWGIFFQKNKRKFSKKDNFFIINLIVNIQKWDL